MQKLAAASALFLLVILCACSKKDSTNTSTGTGLGIDGGTSGPSNTWLSIVGATTPTSDTVFTKIYLNSDHSVSKLVTTTHGFLNDSTADTVYTTTIPVYSGGKLTELQTATDTLSTSGQVTTAFDYTSGGAIQRIRYNPGTNDYAYDSLVAGLGGLLAMSYHYQLDSTTGAMVEPYYESFTWDAKNDLETVLVSNIDPSTGAVSSLTASYTYDGFYNPYKTVKDLPFMLGSLDNILTRLSANNVSSGQLLGYNGGNAYVYQYNPNNLPSSQILNIVSNGTTKQSTFVSFQYIQ